MQNQLCNYVNSINAVKKDLPLNVLYYDTKSLFDKIINYLDWMNPLYQDSINQYPIPYSTIMRSDTIDFFRKNQYINEYGYLFLFHHQSYGFLKKEDISILATNINRYNKISFSSDTIKWNLSKIYHMKYGVPELDYEYRGNKKSIIVLNFNNNQQSHILYSILRQHFPDIGLITNNQLSLKNIYENISEYKICIDLDNYYNLLVGCSVGAYGITNTPSQDNTCIFSITDASAVIELAKTLMNKTHNDHQELRYNTKQNYDFKEFSRLFKTYIHNQITGNRHE